MNLTLLNSILSRIIRVFLGSVILLSSMLLFINVAMRYLFLSPIFWAEELTRYLMVWLIFIGAGALAGGAEGHISVNIITRILSPRGNVLLTGLVSLICVLFCATLTYYSWHHAMRIRSAHQVTAALGLPMWWAYFAVPCGSFFMTLRYLGHLLKGLRGNPS